MTTRIKLYIGLLVLGVVIVGGGLLLLIRPAPPAAVQTPRPVRAISGNTSYSYLIPEGTPVVSSNASYVMRGRFDFLFIYSDGSILSIREEGLRVPSPEHPPTRTWKTGKLREDELQRLISLFLNSEFAALDTYYQFPGKPLEPLPGIPAGGFSMGDGKFNFSVNYEKLQKTVTAFGYLTSDRGLTYPGMPYPLNELYVRLKDIANNRTGEVARETIESSLQWE